MVKHQALTAENLSRSYGRSTIVEDVSLTLEPGRITALLGQSGAGKSTLLRLFAGLEKPDAGTIKIGSETLSDQTRMVPAEKRRTGLIFQDFALFPHMTALKNIAFGLSGMDRAKAQNIAEEWLDRIGLADRAEAYPHQLSGGEQQRIAIARALAPQPLAILMDEPFSGLDPSLREDVRAAALKAISDAGIPALLVTHDATEAMLSADHLAIMRAGKIIQQGHPAEVYEHPVDFGAATALGPALKLEGKVAADTASIMTPFGPLPCAHSPLEKEVIIAVRPESVRIDDTSKVRARVLSCRRSGAQVQIGILCNEISTCIQGSPEDAPLSGTEIGITLDPSSCTVFEVENE